MKVTGSGPEIARFYRKGIRHRMPFSLIILFPNSRSDINPHSIPRNFISCSQYSIICCPYSLSSEISTGQHLSSICLSARRQQHIHHDRRLSDDAFHVLLHRSYILPRPTFSYWSMGFPVRSRKHPTGPVPAAGKLSYTDTGFPSKYIPLRFLSAPRRSRS